MATFELQTLINEKPWTCFFNIFKLAKNVWCIQAIECIKNVHCY